jgi:hypothetical protein
MRRAFGARGAVPHAHRARNASLNQDKNDMKWADLALSAEPHSATVLGRQKTRGKAKSLPAGFPGQDRRGPVKRRRAARSAASSL